MEIFHYSKMTGELLGAGQADKDPLKEEGWLIPANSTTSQPPLVTDTEIAVFQNGEWSVVEDHRGSVFYDEEGSEVVIRDLGPLPAGLSSTPPEPDIEQVRSDALGKVDTDAETARHRYITPGSGQAMVYLEKANEAAAYQAAQNPIDTDYPLIKAEADSLSLSLATFVAIVIQNRDIWKTAAAEIEATRAAAKAAINTAQTITEIETILSGLAWPQP